MSSTWHSARSFCSALWKTSLWGSPKVPRMFLRRSSEVPYLVKPVVQRQRQERRRYWSWCQRGDEDLFKSGSECLGRWRQQHGVLIIMDHYVKCWSVGLSLSLPRSLFDETSLNVTVLMLCQISDGLSSRAFISHLKHWGNACSILIISCY